MTDQKQYKNFENENENDDTESEGIKLKVKKSSWISHYTPVKILRKVESHSKSNSKFAFKNGFSEIKKYFFLEDILMYCDIVNSMIYHFTPSSALVFHIDDSKNISQETFDKFNKYTNISLNSKSTICCSKCHSNSIYPIYCSKCKLFFCMVCILKNSDYSKREISCIECKTIIVSLSCVNKDEISYLYQSEDVVSFLGSYYNCTDCCKIIDVSEYLNHLHYKCKSFNNKKELDDSSNLSIHQTESNQFKEKKIINSINISSNIIMKKSIQDLKKTDSLTDKKNNLNNAVSILSDLKSINNSISKGKSKDKKSKENEEIEKLKASLKAANDKIQSYERSYTEINITLKELNEYQHLLIEKNQKLTNKIVNKNKTIENILDSIKCDICFSNKLIDNIEDDSENSFHSVNIYREDAVNDEKDGSIDFLNASNSRKKKKENREDISKDNNNVVKKLFKYTEENEVNKSIDINDNKDNSNALINTLLNNQKNENIDNNNFSSITINKCSVCNKIICDKCKNFCSKSRKYICVNDYKYCEKCKKKYSSKLMLTCKGCNSIYCDDCLSGYCNKCTFEFSSTGKDPSIEIGFNGLSANTTDKLTNICSPSLLLLSRYISVGVHKMEINFESEPCSYIDVGVFILRSDDSYKLFIESFFSKEIIKFGKKISKISLKENCPYLFSNIPKHPLFITVDCNVMTVEFELAGLKLEKIIESNCLVLPYFILCKNKILMHYHSITEKIC